MLLATENSNYFVYDGMVSFISWGFGECILLLEFQESYKPIFNTFDALAVSDVFIAKRMQYHPIAWTVIDAFKVNFGYDIKFAVQSVIEENTDEMRRIGGSLQVRGDFAVIRRRKLDGIRIACGLIVSTIHTCG